MIRLLDHDQLTSQHPGRLMSQLHGPLSLRRGRLMIRLLDHDQLTSQHPGRLMSHARIPPEVAVAMHQLLAPTQAVAVIPHLGHVDNSQSS